VWQLFVFSSSFQPGTNAVKRRVAVVGGKLEARPIMRAGFCFCIHKEFAFLPEELVGFDLEIRSVSRYTALNYDHRLVDGREAVTFLCSVRDKLEDCLTCSDWLPCLPTDHTVLQGSCFQSLSGSLTNAAGPVI